MYAEGTTVSEEKSRAEIETVLKKYRAGSFGYLSDETRAMVAFTMKGRSIRITIEKQLASKIPRPKRARYNWPTDDQKAAWANGENRRRWRALLLVIKAKLEAVASGIATVEDEFLAYTVTPNGQTMAEWVAPQLATMIERGEMPKLLMVGSPAGVS